MTKDVANDGAGRVADDAPDHPQRIDDPHNTRAGPGDAGAQRRPEVLPRTPKTPKARFARIGLWFIVPTAVLLALYWALI
ncbi:hypothetical protein [Roseovarius dicentrarchi]|uniref:hypothetical protein n=1 Tax=Roseovarius dicentrarchi TaxID=2250573 RepID=UPI000DEA82B6|nr:hypothetical protein [Roseovarius dicentrarchi]